MSDVFEFHEGTLPLLVSVPHDGRAIPDDIAGRMTKAGRDIPDTDWHVAGLYDFARGLGASVLVANYSRYVVDLNRSDDDSVLYPGQLVTGLCPEKTFGGESIYRVGGVSEDQKRDRVERYWRPYHDRLRNSLETIREKHGYALLWDAHSIPGVVPSLFDGELPALNLGSNDGASCDAALFAVVEGVAADSGYSHVSNGRFKGGFITRHYGRPANGVHAIQLEIAQRAYMDEASRRFDPVLAGSLQATLGAILTAFVETAGIQ